MRWDKDKFIDGLAMAIVVIGGFLVFVLCLQPRDGGENHGVAGIGGWQSLVVAAYLIASAYLIYKRTEQRDNLQREVDYFRSHWKH